MGLLEQLRDVAGPAHVLTGAGTAGYATDWTGRFRGAARAVVRPGSTAEVAGVIDACRAAGAALVPQGGNTGLVGGSVPLAGEVVLSTGRLRTPPVVDALAGTAVAGAGVPIAVLAEAAAAAGLAYGVDLASRGSATVGGTVATNAGGLRVLRYGDTRAQLLGVEAVLGDGSTVSLLDRLGRDNAGYHLPSLLAGSEGTLGVVTAVQVRLLASPGRRVVVLAGLPSPAAAARAAAAAARAVPGVEVVELLLPAGLELVAGLVGRRPPLPGHGAHLLVEAAGTPAEQVAEAVAALPGVEDAVVGATAADRERLWQWRERHTEAVNTLGPPVKLDVTLPAAALPEFLDEVAGRVARTAPGARTWLFGHAADGNVHVNVTGAGAAERAVEDAVLELVVALHGAVSSEHGVGTAKRAWLTRVRGPGEVAAYRAIKHALDPAGILNPNVLLPG